MARLPLPMHWACCWGWQTGDCCVREVSDEVADAEVWVPPEPAEHGLPSFTRTGTATLRGELDDCKTTTTTITEEIVMIR
jgi:hypothetical protein